MAVVSSLAVKGSTMGMVVRRASLSRGMEVCGLDQGCGANTEGWRGRGRVGGVEGGWVGVEEGSCRKLVQEDVNVWSD